jgi:hypothetical protein
MHPKMAIWEATNVPSCLLSLLSLASGLMDNVKNRRLFTGQLDAPRVVWISPSDALPSTTSVVVPSMESYKQTIRTFHHHLHAFDQTVDDVESLGNGCLRLLEGESIESLEDNIDFFFS